MELTCPSCGATYQLPADAIGDAGRRVSCMQCKHVWRAYPADVNAAAEAAPHTDVAEDDVQGADAPPLPDNPAREEQLAEIRRMLAEVQTGGAEAPDGQGGGSWDAPAPSGGEPAFAGGSDASDGTNGDQSVQRAATMSGGTEAAAATVVAKIVGEGKPAKAEEPIQLDDDDPLQAKLAQLSRAYKTGKKDNTRRNLIRKHGKKVRRRRAREAAGTGAFMTGFMLITMIGVTMTSLYVLHPQIIAQMPESRAAMTQYVGTIDGVRVGVMDKVTIASDWVMKQVNRDE